MSTKRQRSHPRPPAPLVSTADPRSLSALDDRLWAPLAECGVRHFGRCCGCAEGHCCVPENEGRASPH